MSIRIIISFSYSGHLSFWRVRKDTPKTLFLERVDNSLHQYRLHKDKLNVVTTFEGFWSDDLAKVQEQVAAYELKAYKAYGEANERVSKACYQLSEFKETGRMHK